MIWVLQSVFGLFVDATVGQVVRALSAGPPLRSLPALPSRPSLPPAPAGPPVLSLPVESWRHVEPDPAPAPQSPAVWRDQDLQDDDVKLVRYSIVSLRRCHERLLKAGQQVVTESMTGEGFAAWMVASWAASSKRKVAPEDLRYLRVTWEVIDRWPRRKKDCRGGGGGETEALREILGTLRGFSVGQIAVPAPAPPGQAIVWDGTGTPSQVGARGRVTLTRRWNGTSYDVTLDGKLSIRSRSYGHVRHALPPGFLPVSADPRAGTCVVQRHAALGDTTALDNYGGRGVHVRRGDFPGYEGRATLWFPERTSGEYTLRCTWQTQEEPPA